VADWPARQGGGPAATIEKKKKEATATVQALPTKNAADQHRSPARGSRPRRAGSDALTCKTAARVRMVMRTFSQFRPASLIPGQFSRQLGPVLHQ